MQLLVSMLRQKCVYWEPTDRKDLYGQPVFETPVELRCRWVQHVEEMVNANGRVWKSTNQVFVPVDTKLGGVLFLGTLTDLVSTTDPFANPEAYEINNVVKTPTLSAKQFLRIAYL